VHSARRGRAAPGRLRRDDGDQFINR